jgi:hypothetical protein
MLELLAIAQALSDRARNPATGRGMGRSLAELAERLKQTIAYVAIFADVYLVEDVSGDPPPLDSLS